MDIVPIDEVAKPIDEIVEIEFFNKENKKSVYNMMPEKWRTLLERRGIQEELEKEEWEVKKGLNITPTLNRLRYSFWNEYYRAVDSNRGKMVQKNIFRGVCSMEVYQKMLMNNAYVAWILCPPSDTVVALRETLNYGLDRVREIMDLPLYKIESVKVGKDEFEDREVVDEKVANLMLKAVAMVDLRLHGSYVQVAKIEQKTLNVNKNVTNVTNEYVESTPDFSIDQQLEMLRNEVKQDVRKLEAPINRADMKVLDENDIAISEMTAITPERKEKSEILNTDIDYDLDDL
jgi:hypothetical protein